VRAMRLTLQRTCGNQAVQRLIQRWALPFGLGASTATELSGAGWVAKFPGSKAIGDLESGFQASFQKFDQALAEAGATRVINASYRPPERAYMMHWCYRIAKLGFDPKKVPAMDGVDINWDHGDTAQSRAAASAMVAAFGMSKLKTKPALRSRHTQGKAIDMNVSWSGTLKIKRADGTEAAITSTPRDSTNVDLIAVAATYGVIHYKAIEKDRIHWSTDGR
jgi:hypothetical protein